MKQVTVRIAAAALFTLGTLAASHTPPDTTMDPTVPMPVCPTCGWDGKPVPPPTSTHLVPQYRPGIS